MLIDIYARSMITAARQDGLCLRDLPAAKPLPQPTGRLGRLAALLTRHNPLKRPRVRCIDPLKL